MTLNVSLRHLRCFLAIAQCGSFTAASAKLFLTQSSLTAAIQQLEEAVGLKLFDRTTRSVELTREAVLFLPQAEKIIRDFDGAMTDLQSIAQSQSGEVRIAAPQSIVEIFLAEAISIFKGAYPSIRFTLREHGAERSEELVAQGEVDFALAEKFRGYADLSYEPLFADRFGVISAAAIKPSRKGRLSLADLPPAGYVAFTADTGISTYMATNVPELFQRGNLGDQVSTTTALFSLLRRTGGYSVIPALPASTAEGLGLHFQPLADPALSREINMISRKLRALSPTSTRLLETLHQVIELRAAGIQGVSRIAMPAARHE